MDRQGDMLAIHRGDGNRDDFLRYPKKMDVEDEYKTEAFRDGDEQQNNLVVERDGLQTKDGENDEQQITCEKNDCSSPKVDALEDLKASCEEEVGFCSPESVNREDEDEPLESVNRDEEEQTVLERDAKVLGFVSRDNKESASDSSPDTKVSNGHFDVVGTEEDTGTSNRCGNGDGNRVFGKDGEDNPQVDNSVIRKMEMIEVTGEQDSPEAVKSAGETSQNVYFNGPVLPQSPSQGHRRAQSEIGTPGHRRTNSFQKLKTQMQKAWRGVSNLRDDNRPTFNPEVLANQKRQWYQLHSSKALLDQTKYKEPTSLFEHFIIVGLHPETDLKPVEEAFRRRKKWETEMSRYEVADYRILRHRGPQFPVLQPQILFKYPPGKKVAMRPKDLAAFCFPGGVKALTVGEVPVSQ